MYRFRQLSCRLADSLRAFRERGLWAGLAELGRTLSRIVYQHAEYVVLANELSQPVLSPSPKPGLVIRQMTHREGLAVLGPITSQADLARFYELFDNRSVVFVAYRDNDLVGYCWISQEADGSVNRLQPPLRKGDAYVHDLFVSLTHRNQGIGKALVSHRLEFLREHGYRRAIAVVLKENTPALKVDNKTGYSQIGSMSHTRILFCDRVDYVLFDA
jgi:GNAT superfamily N-acetyltransferase